MPKSNSKSTNLSPKNALKTLNNQITPTMK